MKNMKTYTLITKPYKIRLTGMAHKMKHVLAEDRWIDFTKGTEMWCCKARSDDHSEGISLIVFNHSWMSTFKTDSIALRNRWHVNTASIGDWKTDLHILVASYPILNIMNPEFKIKKFEDQK